MSKLFAASCAPELIACKLCRCPSTAPSWFDPKEFQNDPWWCDPDWPLPPECVAEYPYDPNGHGSHCMGSAVGSREAGISVAPGARWIAAKGCRDGSCFDYGLTTSMQWALCPTDLNGQNPRCEMGADVVSNSWGGPGGDTFRMDTVVAWRQVCRLEDISRFTANRVTP